MSVVRVGEINLSVTERGQGVPLVLVHGFPLDHTMWQAQLEGLSDVCRVIAPDLRGFGQSDVTTGTVSMEQFADDVAAMLDELQVTEPVVFCGLSMGGYIAWHFRRKYPSRLKGLILCDTKASADSEEVARGRLVSAEQVVSSGPDKLIETLIPKLFADQTILDRPELVAATKRVIRATNSDGIAAALRGMAARPDTTAELINITQPTLVLCGEHDVITRATEMRDMAARIPNARFEIIPNAGHMAPLEQPEAVNKEIVAFLASL